MAMRMVTYRDKLKAKTGKRDVKYLVSSATE